MRADNDRITFGSGNVFKDLDVVFSRDEWEALCLKSGSKLPYPFADVVQFKPRSDRPPELKAHQLAQAAFALLPLDADY